MTVATKLTPEKVEKFLSLLCELGNVTKVCEMLDISREAVYKAKRLDDNFAGQWDEAVKIAADGLEEEAWRRARDGIDKPLSYQGQLTGDIITEYSDTLLIFLLKGNKPEKFKERHSHDANIKTENTVIYIPENNRNDKE